MSSKTPTLQTGIDTRQIVKNKYKIKFDISPCEMCKITTEK